MTPRARLFVATAAIGLVAVPALAATPDSGTVSESTPRVTWTGDSVNGGATTIPAVANGGTVACVPPSCDTFKLEVATSADLTLIAKSDLDAGFTMLEVVRPDGSKSYSSG